MSHNATPTPFEIASLAVLLALRERPGTTQHTTETYLTPARSLLAAAAAVLAKPTPPSDVEQIVEANDWEQYPFAQVLTPNEPKDGEKKGRTMVGSITTREGLVKAIRRVYEEPRVADILQRGWLYELEIKAITADQAKRNKLRTAAANEAKGETGQKKSADFYARPDQTNIVPPPPQSEPTTPPRRTNVRQKPTRPSRKDNHRKQGLSVVTDEKHICSNGSHPAVQKRKG